MNRSKGHMIIKALTFVFSLAFTVLCMESFFKDQTPKMFKKASGFWETALTVAAIPLIAVLSFCFVYLCFRIIVAIYTHLIGDYIYFSLMAFAKSMFGGFIAFAVIMLGILKLMDVISWFLAVFCILIVALAIYDLVSIIRFFFCKKEKRDMAA